MDLRDKQLLRVASRSALSDPKYTKYLIKNANLSDDGQSALTELNRLIEESLANSNSENLYSVVFKRNANQLPRTSTVRVFLSNALQADQESTNKIEVASG